MARPEQTKPIPENPQFALANRLMSAYIGALGLAKEMQDKAHIDALTGLPNQYQLEEDYAGLQQARTNPKGERERATDTTAEQPAEEHSILLGDLDHFKQINDNGGHARGNRVLRRVGETMRANVRNNDLPVRLHGEEFAVLLPRTTSEQAGLVAEALRSAVKADGDVTISIGVSGLDMDKSLEDNMVNADTALYQAKEDGRDRVVRFEDMAAQQQAQAAAAANGHRP